MYDFNSLNYRIRPFSQVKQYAIHPLSDKGFKDYISKDSYARKYLNKVHPQLVEEFEQDVRRIDLEEMNIQHDPQIYDNDRIKTPNDKDLLEDKIRDCFKINDLTEENESNMINYDKKRAKTSHNLFKPSAKQQLPNPDRNIIHSASIHHSKNQNPILRGQENLKLMPNFVNNTSQGFFNKKKSKLFVMSKSKGNFGRFNQKYIDEMEKLSKMPTSSLKLNSSRKGYDGFQPNKVPHSNHIRSISDFKENSLMENYSRQMLNSLKLETRQFNKPGKLELNKLCDQENKKLKLIIRNQSNSEFLSKAKLPTISYIVNQPKFLLSNSKTQYSKNFGEKYNPFNYQTANSINGFKRNTYGGHFGY